MDWLLIWEITIGILIAKIIVRLVSPFLNGLSKGFWDYFKE